MKIFCSFYLNYLKDLSFFTEKIRYVRINYLYTLKFEKKTNLKLNLEFINF